MKIDYVPLIQATELSEVSANTYVLVEENGVIKKILASNLNNVEVSNNED